MKSSIKYSIIVPAYNVDRYIARCLDSLVQQNFEDMEIIIVDDGSTDRTLEIMEKYKKKYKIIKTCHQKNSGLVAARKKGIEEASGIYCLMVDADDWLERDAIHVIDKYIRKYKDLDVLKFRFIYEPAGKRSLAYKTNCGVLNKEELSRLRKGLLFTDRYNNLCNQVFKKELYAKAYDKKFEKINYGEDLIVNLGLIGSARNVALSNEPLYHYFENPCSISHKITIESISKNLSDNLFMYKERLRYLKFVDDVSAGTKMIRKTLMISVCDRIKQYISCGGVIGQELQIEVEKSGIYAELKNFDFSILTFVNKFIIKCVLSRQYNRLIVLRPYMVIRKRVRKTYFCFLAIGNLLNIFSVSRKNRRGFYE